MSASKTEHYAEQLSTLREDGSKRFATYRRTNYGHGIAFVVGYDTTRITGDGTCQAIRFRADMWSVESAKQWLRENAWSDQNFQPAKTTTIGLLPKKE